VVAATDRTTLPDGVCVRDGRIVDEVRGASWPLNPTAEFVLARVGRELGTVVDELAAAYALPRGTARRDVLVFVHCLNEALLLNVEHRARVLRRWLELAVLAARLLPAGMLPAALARRRRLDTSSAGRAAATAVSAVGARCLALAALVSLIAVHLEVVAGRLSLLPAVLVGVGAGAGVAAHEAGHAAALRRIPAAVVLHGRRTYVLHRRLGPGRRAAVALAGPLPVAVAGGLLVLVAVAADTPTPALAGLAPAAHALSLTVATSDGRAACGL
jgi:Coenzyme PQQ synthesis protein D (PqqD)